jgi:hypothetical protein
MFTIFLPKYTFWQTNRSHIEEVEMAEDGIEEKGGVVLAQYAQAGRKYLSGTGREVIVKGRLDNRIIVQSVYTGNDIPLPLTYALRELEQVPAEA